MKEKTFKKSKRIPEIDAASGLAIVLVVVGHLSDYLPDWYGSMKTVLYKFHMPFFMFISGFLLAHTTNHIKTFDDFSEFIKKKFIRFSIPYIFMSFLFLGVKLFLHTYPSKDEIKTAILSIFIEPTSGPSIFLWYLYVLFMFYLVFTLLMLVPRIKRNPVIVLVMGIVLYALLTLTPITGKFEIDSFCHYFFYISLGTFVSYNYDNTVSSLKKIGYIPLILFLVLLVSDVFFSKRIAPIILGLLSIPSILYGSLILKNNRVLQNIGGKTFTIYLWNSVFVFSLSHILMTLDANYYNNFIFYFLLLSLIGIFGPLVLRNISRKFKLNFLYRIIP